MFEDFDRRLSQFPQFNFFSVFVFILYILCLHFLYSVLVSLHHEDHAYDLLCFHLSTYSTASSSSLRNFLTLKFLSEEFIKIAYSPPSSRYNALSILPYHGWLEEPFQRDVRRDGVTLGAHASEDIRRLITFSSHMMKLESLKPS